MAREFAKAFYKSKAWKGCRAAYFASQYGICERCGAPGEEVHHIKSLTPLNINDPEITLNHDNLMLLCKNCHFQIHEKNKHKQKRTKESELRYMFDENGNILPKGKVIIVWGAPTAGKSTYVKEHMKHMDIRIDLDELFYCFTGLTTQTADKQATGDYLEFIFAAREAAYKLVEQRTGGYATAWVIAMLPNKSEREQLAKRLDAELVYIDISLEEALKRAENRENTAQQRKNIENFFANLQI